MKNSITRIIAAGAIVLAIAGWTIPMASATDLGEFNFTTRTDGGVIPATVGEIDVVTSVNGGSSNSITLPSASGVPSGRRVTVINAASSGQVGIFASGTDLIVGGANGSVFAGNGVDSMASGTYAKKTYVSDGASNWYVIS